VNFACAGNASPSGRGANASDGGGARYELTATNPIVVHSHNSEHRRILFEVKECLSALNKSPSAANDSGDLVERRGKIISQHTSLPNSRHAAPLLKVGYSEMLGMSQGVLAMG
jgi:hypothetical protein